MTQSLEPRPQPGGFEAPPWGALGALVGLIANVFVLIVLAAALFGVFELAGFDVEGVPVRYSALFLFQLVLLVAPTAAVIVLRTDGRALGLVPPVRGRMIPESIGIGVLLSALAWLYAVGLRWLAPEAYESMIAEQQKQMELLAGPVPLLLIAALIVAPICEEIFFRAFFFAGLRSRLDFATASAVSALVFAFVHMMLWSTPPLFLVGLGMALVYERHRSVAAPIVAHATFNGTELFIAWVLT
jgi:hypothetical protein